MVRCTRASSARSSEEVDGDEDMLCDDAGDNSETVATEAKRIQPDIACHRKFLIAKGSVNERKLYMLRHPRSSTGALYVIGDEAVEEVLRIDDPHRSFFYGESVIADGSITVFSAIHPLFLALPYLMRNAQNRFAPLEDILLDEEFPAVRLLSENKKLHRALLSACASKEVCSTEVWQYSEAMLLKWLEGRFDRLKKSLLEHGTLHKAITENDVVLRRYTYSILCDFIPPSLTAALKAHLAIEDLDPLKEKQVLPVKRKADGDELESYFDPTEAAKLKKPAALNPAQKRLQSASKGTKSLLGFFAGKK